jgi:beta-glucosidase
MATYPQFPPDFLIGSATAAFQIEGSPAADGKGKSIWDTFTHMPGKISDGENADLACETYREPERDIVLMAELGLNAYRFSVAWSRILPGGRGAINQKGLAYYNRLVDMLLERRITPFITLFHWDTPQTLQDLCGGFVGRDMANYFADYSEIVVRALGDRVKYWITLNEPWEHAFFGHFTGEHAPGAHNPWTYFRVAHHELLGHGKAVERIRSISPDVKVGITLSQFPISPFIDSPRDQDAAHFADLFMNRFYLDGLYKGQYPAPLFRRLWPFRPKIESGDMDIISQSIDFLGVNYYTRQYARHAWYIPFFRAWVDRDPPPGICHPELGRQAYPEGIRELCKRYREEYGNPVVYITENGIAVEDVIEDGHVHDHTRQRYIELYLTELAQAINEGSDVRGYFIWSLMDNFEWNSGFSKRFGLVYVDRQNQQRIIKDSGRWVAELTRAQHSASHG